MLKGNLKWLVAVENTQRIDTLPIGKKEDFQPDLCLPKNYIITMRKETIPPKKGLFMPALFSGATSLYLGTPSCGRCPVFKF